MPFADVPSLNVSVPTLIENPDAFPSIQPFSSLPPGLLEEELAVPYNESFPCPLGFFCQDVRMVNCTFLRGVILAYGLGDLLAGISCPEGLPGYTNCPLGSYCPNPVSLLYMSGFHVVTFC